MSRTAFAALLEKYQNGDATDAERRMVEQWYALLEKESRPLTAQERRDVEERLWQALQEEALGRKTLPVGPRPPFWQQTFFRLGAAAAIGLAMFFSYRFYEPSRTDNPSTDLIAQEQDTAMKKVANGTDRKMSLVLEDSSRVLLSPGGELKFPRRFADEVREVYLTGEAFFEVSENPQLPFLVNAGEITTRVLGTSFLVNAPADQTSVEVSVRTGKVTVYERDEATAGQSNKKGSGVVLAANHRVTFSAKDKLFLTALVENPVPLPAAGSPVDFDFDDTPMIEVLHRLEAAYHIKIEMERKTLGFCPFTADLSDLDLYEKLDIICATIQGEYDVKGTTILISGKGCDSGF